MVWILGGFVMCPLHDDNDEYALEEHAMEDGMDFGIVLEGCPKKLTRKREDGFQEVSVCWRMC